VAVFSHPAQLITAEAYKFFYAIPPTLKLVPLAYRQHQLSSY